MTTNTSLAHLFQYLIERCRGRFYGDVRIRFREGKVTLVQQEQSWADVEQLPVADEAAVRMMRTGDRTE